MKKKFIKVALLSKIGRIEIQSEKADHATYFHPIPINLVESFKIETGTILEGYYGKSRDTGKKDIRCKRIFTSYFIPTKVIEQ